MREKPPPYIDVEATESLTGALTCSAYQELIGFRVTSCGWGNDSDDPENPCWKFYIGTPDLDKIGLKEAYIKLHIFLDKLKNYSAGRINWQDITLEQETE